MLGRRTEPSEKDWQSRGRKGVSREGTEFRNTEL